MAIEAIVWSVLLVLFITFQTNAQSEPSISPCPNLFAYKTRSDSYQYGALTVPSPPLNEPSVTVIALFTLRSRLPTKYGGLIELFASSDETIRAIEQRKAVQFLIHFPVQSPLPKLKYISYNNRIICESPESDYFMLRRPLLNIEFKYTFNTIGIVATNEFDFDAAVDDDIEVAPMTTTTAPATTISTSSTSSTEAPRPPPDCGKIHSKFKTTPLIAGGQPIKRGTSPWLAAIYRHQPAGPAFACSGNLVSKRVVISAASCFVRSSGERPLQAKDVLVALGRHDMATWMEDGSQLVRVASVHTRVNVAEEGDGGDLAAVQLQRPIDYGEFIQPVCLWWSVPNDDDDAMVGQLGNIVGWGGDSDADGATKVRTMPHSVRVPIVSPDECRHEHFRRGQLSNRPTTFCAGYRNESGPCWGDAGAGFIMTQQGRHVLRGIVSVAATDSCDLSRYIVLTDVAKFAQWIREFIRFTDKNYLEQII